MAQSNGSVEKNPWVGRESVLSCLCCLSVGTSGLSRWLEGDAGPSSQLRQCRAQSVTGRLCPRRHGLRPEGHSGPDRGLWHSCGSGQWWCWHLWSHLSHLSWFDVIRHILYTVIYSTFTPLNVYRLLRHGLWWCHFSRSKTKRLGNWQRTCDFWAFFWPGINMQKLKTYFFPHRFHVTKHQMGQVNFWYDLRRDKIWEIQSTWMSLGQGLLSFCCFLRFSDVLMVLPTFLPCFWMSSAWIRWMPRWTRSL